MSWIGKHTLAAATVALTINACGGAAPPPPPSSAAPVASAPEAGDIAPSSDPHIRYFHEQLIANGEDLQSDFGGDLLTLGMNPRDLQQDDPKHAYDTVMAKVRQVSDASLRHAMMRTFFDSFDD